jgi:hypothetical protein
VEVAEIEGVVLDLPAIGASKRRRTDFELENRDKPGGQEDGVDATLASGNRVFQKQHPVVTAADATSHLLHAVVEQFDLDLPGRRLIHEVMREPSTGRAEGELTELLEEVRPVEVRQPGLNPCGRGASHSPPHAPRENVSSSPRSTIQVARPRAVSVNRERGAVMPLEAAEPPGDDGPALRVQRDPVAVRRGQAAQGVTWGRGRFGVDRRVE